MDEHTYVSGVRIHSGETGPRCVVCGEPEANWRHVPSVVFDGRPAHRFVSPAPPRQGPPLMAGGVDEGAVDVRHCAGCRDDFYNGHNDLGVQMCWMLSKAKLVTRYRIHRDSMPAWKGAFTEMLKPDCYHQQGYCFSQTLPDFVRPENVIRPATPEAP